MKGSSGFFVARMGACVSPVWFERTTMPKRRGDLADLKQCSWAVQLCPQDASRLIEIENHLQSRVARSGCTPAPFNACFVRHERCAVVLHMRTPVQYHGMVDNVRRWCGSDFLGALSRWDAVSLQDLVANESMDISFSRDWAVQIQQDRAWKLAELANHLERRFSRSGGSVPPAPFSA